MDPAKFMAAEAAKAMLEAGPPSDDDDDDFSKPTAPAPVAAAPARQWGDPHRLSRFLIKQQEDHRKAVKELQNGRKCSCWSWWIFPTPPWIVNGVRKGSATNWEYELKNDAAGTAYIRNRTLRANYLEVLDAMNTSLESGVTPSRLLSIDVPRAEASCKYFKHLATLGDGDTDLGAACARALKLLRPQAESSGTKRERDSAPPKQSSLLKKPAPQSSRNNNGNGGGLQQSTLRFPPGSSSNSNGGASSSSSSSRPGQIRQATITQLAGVVQYDKDEEDDDALDGIPKTLYLGESDLILLKEKLHAHNDDPPLLLRLLKRLSAVPCTRAVLEATKIGVTVGKMRQHADEEVSELAERIVTVWKRQLAEHKAQAKAATQRRW